jgi:phage protein D
MTSGAFTLAPQITIDGEDAPAIAANIVAVEVEETTAGLYRCEIELLNFGIGGYLYLDRETLDFGQQITLTVGFGDSGELLFEGRITGLEATYVEDGGSRLTVLAEDRLQDLRMTRRTRTFEDVTDEDVMRRIAQEHSLQPQFEDLSGPSYRVLAQTNLSDLAFVRECARRLNAEIWLDGTTLHAAKRTSRGDERVELAYGAQLHECRIRADLAHQCTELSVSGWDPQSKDAIQETADESAVSSELNGLTSGSSVLSEVFGERKASLVHTVPLSTSEAQAVAEARYRERARRFVTGTGTADGNPRIRVGALLKLVNMGQLFDGEYIVVRALHRLGMERGYETEFDIERAGIGEGATNA